MPRSASWRSRSADAVEVGEQDLLGDLERQVLGRKAGLGDRAGDGLGEIARGDVGRGDVERQAQRHRPVARRGQRRARDVMRQLLDQPGLLRRSRTARRAPIRPRSGCRQRASASAPTSAPSAAANCGWNRISISSRSSAAQQLGARSAAPGPARGGRSLVRRSCASSIDLHRRVIGRSRAPASPPCRRALQFGTAAP